MKKIKADSTRQTIIEDSNLDIFNKIVSPSEPAKELLTKKLLIFKH
jgi:hypothetical protein